MKRQATDTSIPPENLEANLQREMGGTALAVLMKQELHGFIEGMNCPDDLLNHSKEYFEQMTCGDAAAPREGGGGSDWLAPQTELGQFVRAVALAIKSRQFEVPPPDLLVAAGQL